MDAGKFTLRTAQGSVRSAVAFLKEDVVEFIDLGSSAGEEGDDEIRGYTMLCKSQTQGVDF